MKHLAASLCLALCLALTTAGAAQARDPQRETYTRLDRNLVTWRPWLDVTFSKPRTITLARGLRHHDGAVAGAAFLCGAIVSEAPAAARTLVRRAGIALAAACVALVAAKYSSVRSTLRQAKRRSGRCWNVRWYFVVRQDVQPRVRTCSWRW